MLPRSEFMICRRWSGFFHPTFGWISKRHPTCFRDCDMKGPDCSDNLCSHTVFENYGFLTFFHLPHNTILSYCQQLLSVIYLKLEKLVIQSHFDIKLYTKILLQSLRPQKLCWSNFLDLYSDFNKFSPRKEKQNKSLPAAWYSCKKKSFHCWYLRGGGISDWRYLHSMGILVICPMLILNLILEMKCVTKKNCVKCSLYIK